MLFFLLAVRSSGGEYRAEFVSRTDCCPSKLVFSVSGTGLDAPKELVLEARVEEMDSFFVYNGKRLVLEGQLRYGGTIVVVANLETRRQEHVFWTYGHAFSPSKRYLAYETHYPRMGGFHKTLVVLYDLEKTPEENMDGIVASDRFSRTVGRPLYPLRNSFERSLLIEETNPRFSTSGFGWSPVSDYVAFFVNPKSPQGVHREPMQLIVAGPLSDEGRASLWRQEVDFNDFVLPGQPPLNTEEKHGWAAIESLSWEGQALIVTSSSIHEGHLPAQIEFPLPGASTRARE